MKHCLAFLAFPMYASKFIIHFLFTSYMKDLQKYPKIWELPKWENGCAMCSRFYLFYFQIYEKIEEKIVLRDKGLDYRWYFRQLQFSLKFYTDGFSFSFLFLFPVPGQRRLACEWFIHRNNSQELRKANQPLCHEVPSQQPKMKCSNVLILLC